KAAFSDPQQPAPEEATEFAPLLESLGKALDSDDSAAVERLCDIERFIDEVVSFGGGKSWPGGAMAFRRDFRNERPSWFTKLMLNDKTARWKKLEIRRVRWSADRREAVLVTTHRDGTDEKQRWRWWVIRNGNEWKLYDNEDLVTGLRASTVCAA